MEAEPADRQLALEPIIMDMRFLHLLALSTLASLLHAGAVASPNPVQDESPEVKAASPMAPFARMEGGEWRVTFESGASQFDVWTWGPGRHSMQGQTHGCGAIGEPWRALTVVYWHPGREQVRLLALSPFARGVSEGTMRFEGEIVDAEFDLHQTGGPREMGQRWTFDGPDRYLATLWDAGHPPLGEWEYVRSTKLTEKRPRTGDEAPRPSKHLRVFESLLGHAWEARGKWATGEAIHIRSTFEYVPYADGIHVRTVALTADGEPTHLLDAYLYHHTGTGALRCLALSSRGGVYEGDVTVLEGGALQLDLTGSEGDEILPRVVRLDLEEDGTLRQRAWSREGTERTLILDVRHQHSTTARDQAAPIGPDVAAPQISEYIREVFQDREGDYWFGTNGDGVCHYDGESLTYLSVEEGFGGRAVRGIVQDESGAMWFATEGGVSRYESGTFTNYTVANGLSDNSVWSMMLDTSGTIWVGTHGGVCRFDGDSFVPFPLPRVEVEHPTSRFTPKVVFAMFEDQAGSLWFGTDGEGAHRYDGTSFTSYTTKDGLAGNLVRSIRGDRRGRIWLGSDGGGVSCYDGSSFRNFTSKDGLSNDRVFEILEDSAGHMWFSTLGAGACRYDGTSFKAFGVDQGLASLHPRAGDPANIHVQEFFEDRDGILWLGCSGGLFRSDGESFVNVTRHGPWPHDGGSEGRPRVTAE
jgi:hypothetical protein